MSRCRTPSAVALVLAAAGLSGGLAMPAAMAALPPGVHHRVPRPAATTGPSTMPSPAGTATVMPTPTGLPSPPGPSRPAPAIPVRIAATLSQSTVIYGTQVTLSGSLLGRPRPGQAYLPVPGQRVAIYSSPGPSGPVATTTTDQDGSFRLPLPAEAATTVWTLVAGGALDARTATATLTETVRLPTAFSGFSVTLDQYGHLGYSGCLGLPAGAGAWGGNSVTIQYAAQPRGPWHALASAALTSTPCGHGGQEFSGRTTARLNLAYYRAYFPGGTPSYLASASQAVLAWKFADRITSFLVSPASTGQPHCPWHAAVLPLWLAWLPGPDRARHLAPERPERLVLDPAAHHRPRRPLQRDAR